MTLPRRQVIDRADAVPKKTRATRALCPRGCPARVGAVPAKRRAREVCVPSSESSSDKT